MSPFVSSSAFVSAPQASVTRNVADRSNVLSTPLLDQPFVVGPGFSPVPAKLVAQILSDKYVDLSELLAVTLVQKKPEPQLLLDGRLVLTSQPKRQRRRIEDIVSCMEAFAIFSLILVTHFPHQWKDLMQYQLLILRTFTISLVQFGWHTIKLSANMCRHSSHGLVVHECAAFQSSCHWVVLPIFVSGSNVQVCQTAGFVVVSYRLQIVE